MTAHTNSAKSADDDFEQRRERFDRCRYLAQIMRPYVHPANNGWANAILGLLDAAVAEPGQQQQSACVHAAQDTPTVTTDASTAFATAGQLTLGPALVRTWPWFTPTQRRQVCVTHLAEHGDNQYRAVLLRVIDAAVTYQAVKATNEAFVTRDVPWCDWALELLIVLAKEPAGAAHIWQVARVANQNLDDEEVAVFATLVADGVGGAEAADIARRV